MSQLHVLDLRNNSFDRLPNQFTQYPGLQLKDVYLSSKYATFIQQQKKNNKTWYNYCNNKRLGFINSSVIISVIMKNQQSIIVQLEEHYTWNIWLVPFLFKFLWGYIIQL